MNKKALVVIDVQNYFVTDATRDLPEKIAQYIHGAKVDFILFTKFVNSKNSSISRYLGWNKMMSGSETEINATLAPLVNPQHTFEKDTYSAFKAPGFSEFLTAHNVTEITLCGIDTDGCVLATLYDGFDRGHKISVLTELCGSHSGKSFHDAALKIIDKNLQ